LRLPILSLFSQNLRLKGWGDDDDRPGEALSAGPCQGPHTGHLRAL
jgi:hypothetical protein